jgi:hypothetical protein
VFAFMTDGISLQRWRARQVSQWLGHSIFTLPVDVYGDYISRAEGGKAATLARPTFKPAETSVVSIGRQKRAKLRRSPVAQSNPALAIRVTSRR